MAEHSEFNTGSYQMTRGKECHYFIEIMMKALIPLKKITLKQLDRAYLMTVDDLSYELEPKVKNSLFQFVQKMKRVLEVEKSTAMHRYDLVAIDQNGNTCIVDWKTGQKYIKDIDQVRKYLAECEDIKVGYVIYLDLDEQIEINKELEKKQKEEEEEKSKQRELESRQTRSKIQEKQAKSLSELQRLRSTSKERKRARSSNSAYKRFNLTEIGKTRNMGECSKEEISSKKKSLRKSFSIFRTVE
jgi:hypothetical protein